MLKMNLFLTLHYLQQKRPPPDQKKMIADIIGLNNVNAELTI